MSIKSAKCGRSRSQFVLAWPQLIGSCLVTPSNIQVLNICPRRSEDMAKEYLCLGQKFEIGKNFMPPIHLLRFG